MAGRSSLTMIVTNTPAKDLAYTNFAYCSPADLRNFVVPGSKMAYALVADAYVLSISAHDSISDGQLGLNVIHRRYTKVSTGDSISVSRFIPPEDFNLALLTLELEFVRKGTKDEQVDAVQMANQIRKRFGNQVMTAGQKVTFEYHGNGYIFTVNQAQIEGHSKSNKIERGLLSSETYIIFEAANGSGIKITNQREAASSSIFRQKEFNLESLGIGGLSAEFADIFRRAFASRVFPPHVSSKLGIKHVKGMLLYGPPGTGKTLMARQIGKMLNGKEPKIVNGPEVLSKFVGETEKNVRDLFADAEQDQRTKGDQSELHVIIFDEIDAICKSRGSTRDGTGVPASHKDDLTELQLNGIVECGQRHEHIYRRAMLMAEQVKVSKGSPLVTCLLEGPSGSGKSAMAATVGIESDFPYVKIISAETMIGLTEGSKCAQIVKVFEDAYRSPLSIIILDDIERLIEYVAIGPRFSNLISQTLLVLLKRLPPKIDGVESLNNVLLIGMTNRKDLIDEALLR